MDPGPHNLIYFDTRAREERTVAEADIRRSALVDGVSAKTHPTDHDGEIERNIEALLSAFPQLYLCRTAISCMQRLDNLQTARSDASTVVVISTSPEKEQRNSIQRQARSPSPRSSSGATQSLEDLDGLSFLRHVVTEKRDHHCFAKVTPIIMLENANPITTSRQTNNGSTPDRGRQPSNTILNQRAVAHNSQYLGLGAADVLQSPLSVERAQCLPAHAFKTCQDAQRTQGSGSAPTSRKASWVGVNETKPYAYLRESMVSGLMDRICDPEYPEKVVDPSDLHLLPARKEAVENCIGLWTFSAHDFSDDELLWGAVQILRHTLTMPGLEKWRISDDAIIIFLLACRRVYNSFVIYHNFRHACDVLQATFCFLIEIGSIPPFPQSTSKHADGAPLLNVQINGYNHDTDPPRPSSETKPSSIASILRPFDAMTLIISAIGHDVGHPGVNNAFLIALNAPLAQLYNDRSVLESFHCAAFSQILRRYWPAAFEEAPIRKLLINSILATDMSVHSDYINSLDKLNKKLAADKDFVSKMDETAIHDHQTLLCCLLIKCADISNVARQFTVASQWADILTDEFANQATMESELNMPSCLFGGPPVLNDIIKMGASQVGFMNFFGFPLFQKISVALPGMRFAVDQLEVNKATWERTMAEASRKAAKDNTSTTSSERTQSPFQTRRGSQIVQSQMRADPMVFGSHSAAGSPRPRKTSGSGHSHISSLNYNNTRRASLGPTVIPSNTAGRHSPNSGSRRSSGSQHGRFASRIPDVHTAAVAGGIPSPTLVALGSSAPPATASGGLLHQMDGADDDATRAVSAVPNLEGAGNASGTPSSLPSVQQLLNHPPPFVSQDPNGISEGPGSNTDISENYDTSRGRSSGSATGPRSPLRGRERNTDSTNSNGDLEHSNSATNMKRTSSGNRLRMKRGRKFSLKFWRKRGSDDEEGGGANGVNGVNVKRGSASQGDLSTSPGAGFSVRSGRGQLG